MLAKDYWHEALCAEIDPELFFPKKGSIYESTVAKRMCRKCPIIEKCLEYALKDPEIKGIWGGTSEQQRYKLRNRSGKWNLNW
jgi:WhiB family transcriptional regulator, redox-sensing transcriptional regulator